jgi:threonine dehydrogenase-like Zn-dependent dehydrogenase
MFESSTAVPSASSWSENPQTMKAVICHGPEDYRLEEVAVPHPGPGEALIKVEAAGICASDLKCYRGAAKFWGNGSRPAWAETGVNSRP